MKTKVTKLIILVRILVLKKCKKHLKRVKSVGIHLDENKDKDIHQFHNVSQHTLQWKMRLTQPSQLNYTFMIK